jgi:hypothetical protein
VNTRPHRRGLLRDLTAALFGGGAAPAAAAAPGPTPRCQHYYDGVLWCRGRPGQTGYYLHDAYGCPFCHHEQLAQERGQPAGPLGRVTTYVYDGNSLRVGDPSGVTTVTYDTNGRTGTPFAHQAAPRQPPA